MLSDKILKETWDLTANAYDTACDKVGYTNNELRSQVVEWEIAKYGGEPKPTDFSDLLFDWNIWWVFYSH